MSESTPIRGRIAPARRRLHTGQILGKVQEPRHRSQEHLPEEDGESRDANYRCKHAKHGWSCEPAKGPSADRGIDRLCWGPGASGLNRHRLQALAVAASQRPSSKSRRASRGTPRAKTKK